MTARALDDDDGGAETAAIDHAAVGGDYDDVTLALAVQVSDDDERAVAAAAAVTLHEGGTASSTVRLATRPIGPVTVAVTIPHPDVTVQAPAMLTFSSSTWNTAQTFTIRAGEDDDGEDETATLTLNPHGADYVGVPSATSTVNLVDNDPRAVTLSASSLFVPEGNSAAYTVRLATQPVGGDVTVTVSGAGNGITVRPTALTFTGVNWRTLQTVTVSAVEDDNPAPESVDLTHAVAGADYGREGVTVGSVRATTTDNDTPSLYVVPTALTLAEGASGTYAVRLNTLPTGAVTVTVGGTTAAMTADVDGATPGAPTALTFTTSTWNALQTVTVRATPDDDATNATTTLTHAVSGPGGYASLVPAARPGVRVTVDDNDAPGILIDTKPATSEIDGGALALRENDSAQYTVRLQTRPTGPVTVTATSPDSALQVDADASPLERQLTFSTSTWATPQTVTAKALDDLDGGGETVVIDHAAVGGDYDDVTQPLAAQVSDDDEHGVAVAAMLTLHEGGMASSTVRLATRPTGPVTVAVTTPHPDVTVRAPAMLTFSTSTWNTAQTFTIRAGEDDDGEDETATLTLDPHGADYIDVPSATSTVNLLDDDPRGVTLSATALTVPEGASANYAVRLDTQPVGGDVTVTVAGAADGITASPTALTFTGTNWRTPQAVTVRAAQDDNPTHESVMLTHAVAGADYGREGVTAGSVRATTTDNDTPSLHVAPTALTLAEGASGTYAVRLNTLPIDSVTVTVGNVGGIVTVDPTALTFTTSTWSVAQPVTVRAPADADATHATTTLTHAVSGLGGYASLAPELRPSVQVTVNDTDTQGLLIDANPATLDLDAGPLALYEQPGHAANAKRYTVRLATQPTTAVRVSIESGDRAVSVDGDATPRMRTLTFSTSTWSTAQTVTATAVQDDDASNETVVIAHEASGGDYEDVAANLTATTVDDDLRALVLATSTLAGGVMEGGTGTYTVRLSMAPSGTVTVTATATGAVAVDMDGAQAGLQSSLRFDATNWNVARTVTVQGLPDDDAADGAATLRHAATGADYDDIAAADTTFAVIDDDAPAVLLSMTALTVNEGSTAMYTVRLATQPVGGVATVMATSSSAAAPVTPALLQFGAGDWDVPKTFRVRGAQAGSATIAHHRVRRGLRRDCDDDGGRDGARHAGAGGADRAADAGAAGRRRRRLPGAAEHAAARRRDGAGD